MSGSKFIRWSALAAVLAGISGAAVAIISQTQPPVPLWLSIVSLLTSLAALTGIYQYQKDDGESHGKTGFYLALAGSVLLNLGILIEVTGVIYAVGLIMLALNSINAGKDSKWGPALWIASPVIGFSGVIWGGNTTLFVLGSVAFGLGFLGFGLILLGSGK